MGIFRRKARYSEDEDVPNAITAVAGGLVRDQIRQSDRYGTGLGPGTPPGVRSAAIGRGAGGSSSAAAVSVQPWQLEADIYDEHGPGFVGVYLDLVRDKTQTAGIRVAQRRNGDWVPVSYDTHVGAACLGALNQFVGRYEESDTLMSTACRLLAKCAECYVFALEDGTKAVVHPRQVLLGADGYAGYADPVTGIVEYVPFRGANGHPRVWRCWRSGDIDKYSATGGLQRSLVHVREYISAKRRQQSDADSSTTVNGGIAFGDGSELYHNDNDPNDPRNGLPTAMIDYLEIVRDSNGHQYHEPRTNTSKVPFPFIGDKPELFPMGREIDARAFQLEDVSIKAFAKAVRCPDQYLLTGPGQSKYDNEAYVAEALSDDAIAPIAELFLNDLTRIWFRPLLKIILTALHPDELFDVRDFRLEADLDRIRPKVDRTKDLAEAVRLGAVSYTAYAESLDEAPLELPRGMTPYEHFLTIARGQVAIPSLPRLPETLTNVYPKSTVISASAGSSSGEDDTADELLGEMMRLTVRSLTKERRAIFRELRRGLTDADSIVAAARIWPDLPMADIAASAAKNVSEAAQ